MNGGAARDLVFFGAGGQAGVLWEFLEPMGWRLAAVLTDRPAESPVAGVPLLHGDAAADWLARHGRGLAFAVAVGHQHGRVRLARHDLLRSRGLVPLDAVHPSAILARTARVGEGAQILMGAAVAAGAELGRQVIVNTMASVDHDSRLGDGVHVGPGARLCGRVRVGPCAFIGAGAVVLPDIEIGADAIVGAGAVVTRSVPTGATVVGSPARRLDGGTGLA